jgi:valyl-tRNA synthetase
MHAGEVPWRNVLISGWILDPDRKKMSKSRGNVVTPEPLLDEFGADSVRYWAARARLGVDTAYDEQVFRVGKRLCTKLFNASKFAVGQFSKLDQTLLGTSQITAETDRAVIAEIRPLIERATAALAEFDYAQAMMLTEEFFWQVFCDNYLEISKPRAYEEGATPGRLSAASTLRLLHRAVLRMLAPFLPYLTEEIWHWSYAGDGDMHDSIHRSPWPTVDEFAAIPAPSSTLLYPAAVAVIEAIRKAKAEANLSMKAPVKQVTITGTDEVLGALQAALDDITGMLHIEHIELAVGKPESGLVSTRVVVD